MDVPEMQKRMRGIAVENGCSPLLIVGMFLFGLGGLELFKK